MSQKMAEAPALQEAVPSSEFPKKPMPTDPVEILSDVLAHRGWEVREGQETMVLEVGHAADKPGQSDVSIMAPVGTGKTLGYLIPAIARGGRIVVATSTKSLQDQIVLEELPRLAQDLKDLYDYDLTYGALKGKSNYACLAGETPVMTWDGTQPIVSLVGGKHRIIDGDGNWVEAEFKSYGKQKLHEIVLGREGGERRTYYATAEHRWFVQPNSKNSHVEECTTVELKEGDRLAWRSTRPIAAQVRPSSLGIAHGIVTGAGTTSDPDIDGGQTGTVVLHGPKMEMLRYFSGSEVKHHDVDEAYSQPYALVCDVPTRSKTLPDLDSSLSYLYGWLAGLAAIGGITARSGDVTIASVEHEVLEHAEKVCHRLGIVTYGIDDRSGEGRDGYGSLDGEMHSITLAGKTLSSDFYLLEGQREILPDGLNTPADYERWQVSRCWEVLSVTLTDREEEVYCSEVPTTQSFVLGGNLLTGNCSAHVQMFIDGHVQDDDEGDVFLLDDVNVDTTADVRKRLAEFLDISRKAQETHSTVGLDWEQFFPQIDPTVRKRIRASDKCAIRREPWSSAAYDDDLSDAGSGEGNDEIDWAARREKALEVSRSSRDIYRAAYATCMTSQIVVMNSTLLVFEIRRALRPMMPASPVIMNGVDTVIIDEAHHFPRIVAETETVQVDFESIDDIMFDTWKRLKGWHRKDETVLGEVESLKDFAHDLESRIDKANEEYQTDDDEQSWRSAIATVLSSEVARARRILLEFRERAAEYHKAHGDPETPVNSQGVPWRIMRQIGRVFDDVFECMVTVAASVNVRFGPDDQYSFNLTITPGSEDRWSVVTAVPIDVSSFRADLTRAVSEPNYFVGPLKNPGSSLVVMCSGTITDQTPAAVGMDRDSFFEVPSPFDSDRVRMCVVTGIDVPSSSDWLDQAWESAAEAIDVAGGRTLLLTTSTRVLADFTYRARKEFTVNVYSQNDQISKRELVRRFREDETSILIGTMGFWEGVDVPGMSNVQVILDKVPFPQVDSPVFDARRRYIKESGGNPFFEVDADYASIMIAQGVGRLIRALDDVGGVMVLDPRLKTARYSGKLMRLLPRDWPITTDIDSYLDWMEWVNPETREGEMPHWKEEGRWQEIRPRPRSRRRLYSGED